MTTYFPPFDGPSDSGDEVRFDPTHPGNLRTNSGREIPGRDYCGFISGTRHPTVQDLAPYIGPREPGSVWLPSTIPLLNMNERNPLSRDGLYGVDLVIPSRERATHMMVLGVTGAGKNTQVIDLLRFSAILDPGQTVVTFSLKSRDYGAVRAMCQQTGKRLIVVNLNDAWRSVGWNPLSAKNPDVAFSHIRRFADEVKNPTSNDSAFWTQMVKTAFKAGWDAGYRSFPELYELFAKPIPDLIAEFRSHANPSSQQMAAFLAGGSQNADTVVAMIVGALACFLFDSAKRVMFRDELKLGKLLTSPVVIHVEMPETTLESNRVLYQMLARCIADELINVAEQASGESIPATLFFDDFPSLGPVVSLDRLLTMRSRGIGVVAGVQTMSSLELAYGPMCRALVDNFNNKIILPGGPASDAEYFSRASGEQMVSLPCYEGQNPQIANRPLLSGAAIRTPDYSHNLLGKPATVMLGAMTFQAYLQRSYEFPAYAAILREARSTTGRERLRKRRLAKPKTQNSTDAPPNAPSVLPKGISDTRTWSNEQKQTHLKARKAKLSFATAVPSALSFWDEFEKTTDPAVVIRLAEELAVRKATLNEFWLASTSSGSRNIQANLHFMDFLRLKDSLAPPAIHAQLENGIDIVLTSYTCSTLDMVKVVKTLTGRNLFDCKRLVDSAPVSLGKCATRDQARAVEKVIVKAGGSVIIK